MTFARGCLPWNKGCRIGPTVCLRHWEVRQPGTTGGRYCRSCHREATVRWNLAHADRVRAARRRWVLRQGGIA